MSAGLCAVLFLFKSSSNGKTPLKRQVRLLLILAQGCKRASLIVLFVQQLGDVQIASKCGKHDLN